MFNAENIILIEEPTDKFVFDKIVKKFTTRDVIFKLYEGINIFLKRIELNLNGSSTRKIGIIIDANSKLRENWQAVYDRIQRAALDIDPPDMPARDGFIQNPDIRVWVMPDNEHSSALEDFIRKIIPKDSRLKLIIEFIENALNQELDF